MANHHPKLVLGLLSSSGPHHVGHLCLRASLHKCVQVLAALSPVADHEALEWPITLELGHQPAGLTRPGAMVEPVQPLQGAPVLPWQLFYVSFCLSSSLFILIHLSSLKIILVLLKLVCAFLGRCRAKAGIEWMVIIRSNVF